MLYEFKGVIELENKVQTSLSNSHVLLRGCKLKNTPWIHGIVVYSGTKFFKFFKMPYENLNFNNFQ